ncbi:MAG: 3'(2'),5'-bisphosphate nucleotidase CysQ [Balneolales bacterium]
MTDKLISLARRAGQAILSYYREEELTVVRKEDHSPVTGADLASHDIIVQGLKQIEAIPVLSEEAGIPGYEERKTWQRYWLIDPLDGTKEFIKRNGEFTVNIALIKNGEPELGIVYLPTTELTYTGEKTRGSYKIPDHGPGVRIYSGEPDISRALTVTVSRSHALDNLEEKLAEQSITVGKKITAGSSLKFCLVAEGTADIYPRFGPTMEWDTAAGDAVFRYSGRKKERYSPLTYNKPSLKHEDFIIGINQNKQNDHG